MIKLRVLFAAMFGMLLCAHAVWGATEPASTGQTSCYDVSGALLPTCAGSGQTGDIRAGVFWAASRFTDNSNGTITDNLTGLVWLKDGACVTLQNTLGKWVNAIDKARSLANGSCGLSDSSTVGQWRLPNLLELRSLFNEQQTNQAAWLNTQGFSNINASFYWSSTTTADGTGGAWVVSMGSGSVDGYNKESEGFKVWAVRDQISFPAKLSATGQTVSYRTGDDGNLKKGVVWPTPRFIDNSISSASNLTVTDDLTGLTWAKSGNLAPGTKTWQGALDYIKTLNTNSYLGNSDWRLPNSNELITLINRGRSDTASWLNTQGFSNVIGNYNYYWSSGTYVGSPNFAWVVDMTIGSIGYFSKSESYHVWPLRGGQLSALPYTTTSVSAPSISYGNNGVVTVTVSSDAGTPTGSVTLSLNSGAPVSQTLSAVSGSNPPAAEAVFSITKPAIGNHLISANFAEQTAFRYSLASGTLTVLAPSGDLDGGGVTLGDALRALRILAGLDTATTADLLKIDVAPLVNGVPQPDDKIDIGDVIVLLRRVAGSANW